MARRRYLALTTMVGVCIGCAQVPMGAPIPTLSTVRKASASGMGPVAIGEFRLAPGRDAGIDRALVLRTNTIYSRHDNSFAGYLKETLATELRASGLLDPASTIVISATLDDNRLDVPSGTAHALVAATFAVWRDGRKAYERQFRAEANWQASFVGLEALPDALNRYGLLYRALVADLLDDAAFRVAAKR